MSGDDTKKDIKGNDITLYEGLEFYACDLDIEDNEYCLLVCDAVAVLSSSVTIPDCWKNISWLCRTSNIRWESIPDVVAEINRKPEK